jgi:hypothetical protein
MKNALLALLLAGSLQGAEILGEPVPWSGRIQGYSLAELVARMSGWADIGKGAGFHIHSGLPEDLAAKKLNIIQVADSPRPTYGELLLLALHDAGVKAELKETRAGIEIVHLYSRSFKLSHDTKRSLSLKVRWTLEGIKAELNDKGWSLSEHAHLIFTPERSSLIVEGTMDDVKEIARFLGTE